ncbi:hypothetical protein [Streptomyces sp. NPDC048106]|uniref:hypothetical protein n=1 Tax=Streptomyces sp. NPDC048106 TaxID=3155750 RepID=UPI003456F89A
MMARQPNPDLTTTLTMLHTTVMHTDQSIRGALDKSVEKLESAGQAAQEKTTKEVVDELGRMRTDFRDVRNKLNTSGESLNSAVRDVVAQLRAELREVRIALADLTPPAPAPHLAALPAPAPAVHEAAGADGERTDPAAAPVATVTEPDELPVASPPASIPAQRSTDQNPSPGTALQEDAVRQAVREVFAEELAPVLAALNAADNSNSATGGRHDVTNRVLEAAAEVRQEVSSAVEEARSELAVMQREIAGLRAAVKELHPRPDTTTETAEVSPEHSVLLKTAARVSSASLLCHRDIWEFITAHAGQHPHFRVPPRVADEKDERIRAALSGRSLIALLISLHSIKHTASDGDGDQELAATLYERIEESLTGLSTGGEPVTITLDDRTASAPDDESHAEGDGEPEDTGTPPASTEHDPEPGDEAGPTAG